MDPLAAVPAVPSMAATRAPISIGPTAVTMAVAVAVATDQALLWRADRGRRALEEHRPQDVGAFEQLRGGAVEANFALLHEHSPLGQREGHVHRLLDQHDGDTTAVDVTNDVEQTLDDQRGEAERELVDHQQLR